MHVIGMLPPPDLAAPKKSDDIHPPQAAGNAPWATIAYLRICSLAYAKGEAVASFVTFTSP